MSAVDGDTDGDGDLDELFTFGSRSFATWSANGQLLFDSGDEFEQIAAQVLPDFFNAAEDENAFDQRSDDRGPEPEALAVGKLNGSAGSSFMISATRDRPILSSILTIGIFMLNQEMCVASRVIRAWRHVPWPATWSLRAFCSFSARKARSVSHCWWSTTS